MNQINYIFVASNVLKYSDSDSTNQFIQDKEGPFPERALSEFTLLFTLPLRFYTSKNSNK
jgi:hypothetical protein